MAEKEIMRVNTSIKVDPKLWKEAKIQAIKEDLTVSELLEEAIREYIKRKRRKNGE